MIAPPAGRLRLSPALAVALAGGQGTRQWLPRRHGPLRRAIVNPWTSTPSRRWRYGGPWCRPGCSRGATRAAGAAPWKRDV